MSYVDHQILGLELAAVQTETAAADIVTYTFPVAVQVEAFGAVLLEDFTAHTLIPTISLDHLDKIGGTRTEIVALAIDSSNTTLLAGDGNKPGQTALSADTDLDNGDVVFADADAFPYNVLPGESLVFEAKVASGSSGGAYKCFVLYRIGGQRNQLTNVWSHVD